MPAEDEIDFDADDDNNDYRLGFDGTTNDGDDLNGYDEFSDEENENLSETMIHKNRYKRDIKDDSERLIQNEKRHAGMFHLNNMGVGITCLFLSCAFFFLLLHLCNIETYSNANFLFLFYFYIKEGIKL